MKEFYYSQKQHKKSLSNYKILRSRVISKSTFKDSNRIDTVRKGTLLGFTTK